MSNLLGRGYRNLEDNASLSDVSSYYGIPLTSHRSSAVAHKHNVSINGYASSFKPYGTAPGSYVGHAYDEQVKPNRALTGNTGPFLDQRKNYSNLPFTSVPPPASMSHLSVSGDGGSQHSGMSKPVYAKPWPSSSRAVLTSNLDPNSKPFSPRSSSGFHLASNESEKDSFDRDSNANIIQRSEDSQDYDKALLMKKIWVEELPLKPSKQKNVKDTEDLNNTNLPKRAHFFSDANANIVEHERDEKKKDNSKTLARKSLKVLEPGSKFGLKAMLKTVKTKCPYIEPELEFIDHLLFLSPGKPLFEKLDSPFTYQPVTIFNSSFEVPEEYSRITTTLSGKLHGPGKMVTWPSDMLFFFFYMAPGEMLQLLAGNILHLRGWRYVKILEIWVARKKNFQPLEKTELYESGEYQFFNRKTWRREHNYFTIFYNDLADRATLTSEECKLESDQMIYMMQKHYGTNGVTGEADPTMCHARYGDTTEPHVDIQCPRPHVTSRDQCTGSITNYSGSISKVF